MQKPTDEYPIIVNTSNLAYWLATAATVTASTLTLGRLWRRKENHRWTAGYAIIFLGSFPWVMKRRLDLNTWAALFFATGIAGIIKVGLEGVEESMAAETIRGAINGRQGK